jgi:glycogen synthase
MAVKKKNIVIASLLKPVNDVRMYEKFACSLIKQTDFKVHLIGFSADAISQSPKIQFHGLFNFSRSSFGRMVSSWNFYIKILELKPYQLIVNTHDFQIVSSFYQIIFGVKKLYDVQENYMYNILYMGGFKSFIRYGLAYMVRAKEMLCHTMTRACIMAEKAYERELPFARNTSVVIENKFCVQVKENGSKESQLKSVFDALFSGTIAVSYGAFEALTLHKRLLSLNKEFKLTFVGRCVMHDDLLLLNKVSDQLAGVFKLWSSNSLNHDLIVGEMAKSSLAYLPYRVNPAVGYCVPTKFYEYAYFDLVILIPNWLFWLDILFSLGFKMIYFNDIVAFVLSDDVDKLVLEWFWEEYKLIGLVNCYN